MKIYVIIFFFVFLTACNEYTITNKTSSDIQLMKSGGDLSTVPAQSCVRLMEFLIGMGGDFPFSIKDCDTCEKEYMSDHYEIDMRKANSTATNKSDSSESEKLVKKVISSSKNTNCGDTEDEEEEQKDKQDKTSTQQRALPFCENNSSPVCQNKIGESVSNIKVQCKNEESNSFVLICADNAGTTISGFQPTCTSGEKNQISPKCLQPKE